MPCFLPLFSCSGQVVTHGGWHKLPVLARSIRQEQRQSQCGSENKRYTGLQASQEVAEAKKGKEHWAITDGWKETFQRMRGLEGCSSRMDGPTGNGKGGPRLQRRLEAKWGGPTGARSWEHPPPQALLGNNRRQHWVREAAAPQCTSISSQNSLLLHRLGNEPFMKGKAAQCQRCVCACARACYLRALCGDQETGGDTEEAGTKSFPKDGWGKQTCD